MTNPQRDQIAEALHRAQAAVWGKHYGKGLSAPYAQAVDAEIRAALALLAQEEASE